MKPSEILLITIGSSGDVNPFVVFGIELTRRGHDVSVMTSGHFESLVRNAGLAFIEQGTAEEFDNNIRHEDLWHPRRSIGRMIEIGIKRAMRPVYDAIAKRAAAGHRLVVVHSTLAVTAPVAQEKLGVPTVTVNMSPGVFRSAYQNSVVPGLWMPQWLPKSIKRAIYRTGDWLVADRLLTKPINDFRREVGLEPVQHVLDGRLHSPMLTIGAWPAWFAPVQPDWPQSVCLTGFPLYDGQSQPQLSDEVAKFLACYPRPIVFTFGSAMVQGKAFFAASAEACRLMDRPGILLTPYTHQIPDSLPSLVKHFSYAPLNQLLLSVAALVHHGGVGTMAAALAAGVPQLIVPMAFDQPDNAKRITDLGLGRSMRRRAFTGSNVAALLSNLIESEECRLACQKIATRIDPCAGVIAACDAIEAIGKAEGV